MRRRKGNRRNGRASAGSAWELSPGEFGILDRIDLPEEVARRLMELGFLPGHPVTAAGSAPGGEPRVYRVDGSEIALRRETAAHLVLKTERSKLQNEPNFAPADSQPLSGPGEEE